IEEKLGIPAYLNDIFSAPTIAGLSETLKARAPGDLIHLKPTAKQEHYPIAPTQKRLWIINRLTPGSSLYNLGRLFLIEGNLNVPALERALRTMVRRHQSLRTVFITLAGEVRQTFPGKFEKINGIWQEINVSGEPDPWEVSRQYARREFKTPFDFSQGPLLRTRLLKIAGNKYLFVISIHHIITDGWSLDLFMKELNLLYSAFTRGKNNPLPPLPLQYGDYAVWHARLLAGESKYRH
ncbi:MAG: hypothetical protein GY940_34085, partial [bacterium]|nr:hypothetical protein [bacterium]